MHGTPSAGVRKFLTLIVSSLYKQQIFVGLPPSFLIKHSREMTSRKKRPFGLLPTENVALIILNDSYPSKLLKIFRHKARPSVFVVVVESENPSVVGHVERNPTGVRKVLVAEAAEETHFREPAPCLVAPDEYKRIPPPMKEQSLVLGPPQGERTTYVPVSKAQHVPTTADAVHLGVLHHKLQR